MMPTSRRLFLAGLAAATLALSACAGGGSAGQDGGDTITIGALDNLTGTYGSFGAAYTGGLKVAADEINANGGVHVGGKSYKLNVVVVDARSDVSAATTGATSLVKDEHAKFVFGPAVTPITLPAQQVVSRARGIYFTGSVTVGETLRTQGAQGQYGQTYAMGVTSKGAASSTAEGSRELNPNIKTAAILLPSEASYDSYVEEITKEWNARGITIVDTLRFDPATTNFSALLTRIKAADPDVIWTGISPQQVGAIVQQTAGLGFPTSTIVVGSGGAATNATLPNRSPAPFDFSWYAAGFDPAVKGDAVQKYMDSYKRVTGTDYPNIPGSVLPYYGLRVLVAAIEKAGTVDDLAAINTAMTSVSADGPLGAYSFDTNHVARTPVAVCQSRAGDQRCSVVSSSD